MISSRTIRCLASLVFSFLLSAEAAGQFSPIDSRQSFAFDPATCTLCDDKADAIVRLDYMSIQVAGPGNAKVKHRLVVTVLKESGRDQGAFVLFYDRFQRISELEGSIRDVSGKIVRRLKKDDQKDESAISASDLYTDHRVRSAELYYDVFPYTVEYEYELELDGLLNMPSWRPQSDGLPIETGIFDVQFPTATPLRYYIRNTDLEPQKLQSNGNFYWRWEVSHLKRLEPEPLGPSWREQSPELIVASNDFAIEDSRGNMSTWASLGNWFYQLSMNRQTLTADIQSRIDQEIKDAPNDLDRIIRLYRFLQTSTRYISIQLGLGGWRPFEAEFVCRRGYGDCKALVNYMQAMLSYAGIKSHPAFLYSGMRVPDVIPEFPHNTFNHVVLVVPMERDSLWLECTSTTKAPGHVGAANENRWALLVTPDGGKLIRTPTSRSEENRQTRTATVKIDEVGNATAEMQTHYTGNQSDDLRAGLHTGSGREREEWLHESINIPGFRVVSADYSSLDRNEETISIPVNLALPRYATRSGKRMFINPNLAERSSFIPDEVEERKQPVLFGYTYLDIDTIRYQLPAGYQIETVPDQVHLEESYGTYDSSVRLDEVGALVYTRRLEIRQLHLPAELYENYRQFRRKMVSADKSQVVLVKN